MRPISTASGAERRDNHMPAGESREISRSRAQYLHQLASPGTSPNTLAALAAHEDVAIRIVCATHEATPAPALRSLANDPRREVRQATATNPIVARSVLRRLTRDPVHDVMSTAAQNPSIGRRYVAWMLVMRRLNAPLCRAAATNAVANHRELRLAFTNGRWDVRRNAVRHPNASRTQLAHQARSRFWAVRAEVATNPTTSSATRARLAHDIAPVAMVVAGSAFTPSEIIDQLLTHDDPFVRGVAAGNVNASREALTQLGETMAEESWVLRRLAVNSTLPHELSGELLAWLSLGGAGEDDPEFDPVRCTGEPPGSDHNAEHWYRNRAGAVERPELDALWKVRAAAASVGGRTTTARLRLLARDAHAEGRWAAARFPDLDLNILRELAHDENASVATTARWSIDRSDDDEAVGWPRYRRGIRRAVTLRSSQSVARCAAPRRNRRATPIARPNALRPAPRSTAQARRSAHRRRRCPSLRNRAWG
jgi:hypothetical protein